jgi:hypothetical protein
MRGKAKKAENHPVPAPSILCTCTVATVILVYIYIYIYLRSNATYHSCVPLKIDMVLKIIIEFMIDHYVWVLIQM